MKISIILTTYNVENYVEECIDSLLEQTYKNFELIIIDDGSTDNTLNILKTKYKNLNIVENDHVGVAECRNLGLLMAKGEYICILDSDDYFESNMLECMINKMEKYDADVAISSAYKFDTLTREEVITKYMLNENVFKGFDFFSPMDIKKDIFQLTVANAWGKMFKKSLIINNYLKFQNLENSNDVLFVFSAITKAKTIVPVNIPLVHYRANNNSSIQGRKKEFPFEFIKAYEALQNYLDKEKIYKTYKQSFIKMIISIFLWNINAVNQDIQIQILNLLKEKYYNYFNIEDYVYKNDENYKILKQKMGEV